MNIPQSSGLNRVNVHAGTNLNYILKSHFRTMATPPVRVKSPFKKAQTLSNKVKTILINESQQTETHGYRWYAINTHVHIHMQASEEEEIDIDISDVVVGRSVAHGTALPGHFDIDLTVFSPLCVVKAWVRH